MKHPNSKLLLYIAGADACAAATEYVDRREHSDLYERVLRFEGYEQHPRHVGLQPGRYTDDTEMSIANARAITMIAQNPGLYATDERIAWLLRSLYVEEFQKGGKRQGYSRAFQPILEQCEDGTDFERLVKPDSTKNGAAMRAVPMGVYAKPWRVVQMALLQAALTHDTPEGRFSACAVALMSHLALHTDVPLNRIPERCADMLILHAAVPETARFRYTLEKSWDGRAVQDRDDASVGLTTVWAVAHLLRTETSLMSIMRRLIEWGGDTDSVAAIAWGIASTRLQDEVLPDFLARDLELTRPDLGAGRLIQVSTELMRTFRST